MSEPSQPIPPGDALGAAGDSPAVEWRGATYRLGHPTQVAKDRYCEALLDAERRAIDAQFARGWITPAERAAKYDALGEMADRLEHRVGGALWFKYTGADPLDPTAPADAGRFRAGQELFVWALFRENHPDVSVQVVREMYAGCPDLLRLAVRRVAPAFFAWWAEGMGQPPERLMDVLAPTLAAAEATLDELLPAVPATSGGQAR